MARIGLVAGYGTLPMAFADAARKAGDTVIGFGLKGVAQEELAGHVDKMHWLGWGDFAKGMLLLTTERVRKVVMLGKIKKDAFFRDDAKFDEKMRSMLYSTGNRKDYNILKEAAKALKMIGVEVIDPTPYLAELVPSKGVLTKKAPSSSESEDINYGAGAAKELARFDIGQTVAVKDKTVIAAEAVEGTDEMIRRAGSLSRVGFSVIKVARPDQDMRFDIPLVGLDTVKNLIECGGTALALESGKTLLMDRDEIIKLADSKGISIVVI